MSRTNTRKASIGRVTLKGPRKARARAAAKLSFKARKVPTFSKASRIAAVLEQAARAGLLKEKDSRIAGRVGARLVNEAKARTGIRSDSELLAFALANVALEDNFGEVFAKVAGTVDAGLDLEI